MLDGIKSHALDGGEADRFIVPARSSGDVGAEAGISLFVVPAAARGLDVLVTRAIDHRRNARLSLNGVEVATGSLIGDVGAGFPLLRSAVDHAIVARLAEALGVMAAAHAHTLDHVNTRRQFGHAIGTLQAVQHQVVDMAIAYEEALSMMHMATLSADHEPAERRRVVAAAKARVGQTSLFLARRAVQLHGGMGVSDEVIVGHCLKRLIMIDMCFGNAAHHRASLAV